MTDEAWIECGRCGSRMWIDLGGCPKTLVCKACGQTIMVEVEDEERYGFEKPQE